jgi:hypothetical protein
MSEEKAYPIGGAVIVWHLEPTSYSAFKGLMEALGYGQFVPNPRTDKACLDTSIREVYGTKDKVIVSRKNPGKNGVELVNIERDTERNGYVPNFGAKVVRGRVKVDNGYADEHALTEEYLKHKAKLTSSAVGAALKGVLKRMHGMFDFKPGVFFLPDAYLKEWKELARAIEKLQPGNAITEFRVAVDEDTARAVIARLTEEVKEAAAKLLDDVHKGTLNDAQLKERAEQGVALVERVNLYSEITGQALEGLKGVAQIANGAAAAAAMHLFAADSVTADMGIELAGALG